MRHNSDIHQGDEYTFRGLTCPSRAEREVRTVRVHSVSVTGELTIRIDLDGEKGTTLHSLPYSEALLLIRQGIWGPIAGPPNSPLLGAES